MRCRAESDFALQVRRDIDGADKKSGGGRVIAALLVNGGRKDEGIRITAVGFEQAVKAAQRPFEIARVILAPGLLQQFRHEFRALPLPCWSGWQV